MPIAAGQKGLERIPTPAESSPSEIVTERYVVSPSGALGLHVATYYLNDDADWMRDNIVSKSEDQIEKDYLKYYTGLYPGLTSAETVHFVDDRDVNRIAVYESYRLSAAKLRLNSLNEKFPPGVSSMGEFNKPAGGRATHALQTFLR